jgi:CheY-like chemotaxis protein
MGDSLENEKLVEQAEDATSSDAPVSRATGTFCVMLVEDNSFVSELFRHAVRKFQYELGEYEKHDLVMAQTGLEALRLLESTRPDVVILDHYLPGITGCALIRRIRSMPGHEQTPILMISMGGNDVRREALESGASLYMDKPVLLTQLLNTLRTLTAREQACH